MRMSLEAVLKTFRALVDQGVRWLETGIMICLESYPR